MTVFDCPRHIVICGGGTAGWMCAAALSRTIGRAGVSIALVESEEIGTVGVGEATIPTISTFNGMLGLDEDDFLRATEGTFKIGIVFANWGRAGENYLHPFGVAGFDYEAIRFHQFWLKLHQADREAWGEFEDYSLSAVAARAGRFMRPGGDPDSVLSSMKYAYHFDAGLYARYLRRYAEARGVVRIEGRIVDVAQHAHSGDITGVTLEGGRAINGDFFIDCTGFRALLIDETLKAGFEDWSHRLPNDRALAVPSESHGPLTPYTQATAESAGWRWRIPLQHRVGNGHVYCSNHMTDDQAARVLMAGLDGKALGDPRMLKFRAGRRKAFWKGNCVAIGLSAGFLEPLESTSIHLIQTGISKLLALFPAAQPSQADIDEYNRLTALEYEQARDFILLHYVATRRDDSPYWQERRRTNVPETLRQKMELFASRGRVFRRDDDLFTIDSWLAVMLGQGIEPRGYDPLIDALPVTEIEGLVRHVRDAVSRTAAALPRHEAFIAAIAGRKPAHERSLT